MSTNTLEIPFHGFNCSTSEQIAAIKYAEGNDFPIDILAEIPKSILQTVPNGSDKPAWCYGAYRKTCTIGGYAISSFEQGIVPKDVNLSDIRYFGFYRQAVKNKYTGETKGFAVAVGADFAGEVEPGQCIKVKEGNVIRPGWHREDIESAAREAFLKLQEMCEEFYNREAA